MPGTLIDFPAISFTYTPRDEKMWQDVQDAYSSTVQGNRSVYQVRMGRTDAQTSEQAITEMLNTLDTAGYQQIYIDGMAQYEKFMQQ